MSKGLSKKFPCPACGKLKSKKALTCMPCYRRGYGKKRSRGQDLRYDKEGLWKLKERMAEIAIERITEREKLKERVAELERDRIRIRTIKILENEK